MASSCHTLLRSLSISVACVIAMSLIWSDAASAGGPTQPSRPPCQAIGSQRWLSTRPSPLDSAEIVVGGRVAKICYSRPSARGRPVYESLAGFGRTWRTGANEPTMLELSAPATVAGVSLEAGRYAILTIPGPTTWVVMFNTFEASDDPVRIFQTLAEVGRGRVSAEPLPSPVETFVIRGEEAASGSAFLLEWGLLRVRVPVEFRP